MGEISKAAWIFALLCAISSFFMIQSNRAREIPRTSVMQEGTQEPQEHRRPSDVGDSNGELVELAPAEQKKRTAAIAGAANVVGNNVVEEHSPDLLRIGNKYFYLFDTDVVLPLAMGTWREYTVPSGEGYGRIARYYPKEEQPTAWTQEFAIHEVRTDDDCFAFVDKLVTGVIVTMDGKMNGKELTQENLLFSFVKKDSDNAILFWHKKDIPESENEVQFLRCFEARFSKKKYLVTFTLKTSPEELKEADIEEYIRALIQVEELKEKK